MPTPSFIRFWDGEVPVVGISSMYDGYPSGKGLVLAQFLHATALTNGFPICLDVDAPNFGQDELPPTPAVRWGNGITHVAALFVAHLHENKGQSRLPLRPEPIYLEDPVNGGEEFDYEVGVQKESFHIKVVHRQREIFEGNVEELGRFCLGWRDEMDEKE